MLAALLHGGWDTIVLAVAFWLSPFVILFLVIRWAIRKRNSGFPPTWPAKGLLWGWALLLVGTAAALLLGLLAPGSKVGHLMDSMWGLSVLVVLGTFGYAALFAFGRIKFYWRKSHEVRDRSAPHRHG
jgi:hypothetical protein